MALRQLMISRRMAEIEKQLAECGETEKALETRRAAWEEREKKAEEAFSEITEETPAEERQAFEAEAAEIGAEQSAIEIAEADAAEKRGALETELEQLRSEEKALADKAAEAKKAPEEGRKDDKPMNTNTVTIANSRRAELEAIVTRDDVKRFLTGIREKRGVVNADVTVPAVMLPMLSADVARYSKLAKHVNLRPVAGNGQQNVIPEAPEAVWTEAEGTLNPLNVKFGQFLMGAHKIAGYIPVPNCYLVSADVDLAGAVLDLLAKSIGAGLDRAILYGGGNGQPKGIVTRLALTSQPAWWPTKGPDFTDLHSTNIGCLSGANVTGAALFKELFAVLGLVKHQYTAQNGDLFWAMNRKTKIKLIGELISINAAGAVVSGVADTMPVIGGAFEEVECVPDNVIAGGYGDQYLLTEREGATLRSSSDAMFVEDNTVFAASALYDGIPIAGEGFAMFTLAAASGATTVDFPTDYANTALGALTVTTAAHGSTSGKSVITISGKEASGTTLGYIVGGAPVEVRSGDEKTSAFTAISSGDAITAATGKYITVVEFDGNDRAIKVGAAVITAKA